MDRGATPQPGAREQLNVSRRIPTWVIVVALLLAAGAVFPSPALHDVATEATPSGVRLHRPWSYLALAPLLGGLDLLSFLSASQHGALLITALGVFVGARTARRRRGARGNPLGATLALALFAAGCLAIYAVAALVPRPTPTLRMADPEMVRIDFHSHTLHSHDTGDRFTADWNRRWHARTGFDAAFITDHRTWNGIAAAFEANPATASDGVLLMSGVEVWFRTQHAIGIGDSLRYRWTLDPDRRRFEVDSLLGAPPDPPLSIIFVTPGDISDVQALEPGTPDGVIAIEIVNGAPRGLEQSRVQRAELLRLADSLDLALVSGSNLHGYGQSAAAWSLVRIPGWRNMGARDLEAAIEARLQHDRRGAVTVVERTMPRPTTAVALVLTVPALVWHWSATLGTMERSVWLAYLALIWLALRLRSSRRRELDDSAAGRV